VRFRVVVACISEGSIDAALSGTGVAASRMELGDDRHVGARIVRLDGRAHSRAAGTDDEDIVLGLHH
jgi:hypothetical protein